MSKLFRAMKYDENNLPQLGQSARELGVRPNVDIPIDAQGYIHPQTGGMSFTVDDVMYLPAHRRPFDFNGTGKDPVFSINKEQLPKTLMAKQQDSLHHYLIEPNDTYSTLHDHAVQTRIEKTYSARLVEKKLYVKIPISAVYFHSIRI
jgi:hypothetical protein